MEKNLREKVKNVAIGIRVMQGESASQDLADSLSKYMVDLSLRNV